VGLKRALRSALSVIASRIEKNRAVSQVDYHKQMARVFMPLQPEIEYNACGLEIDLMRKFGATIIFRV
jgi:hypothetical protein